LWTNKQCCYSLEINKGHLQEITQAKLINMLTNIFQNQGQALTAKQHKHILIPVSGWKAQSVTNAENMNSKCNSINTVTCMRFPWFNNVSTATTMGEYNNGILHC
jgi:hypothetical protein